MSETAEDEKALALFRAFVDASDGNLADWGILREDILALARAHITAARDDELGRLSEQLIRASRSKGK